MVRSAATLGISLPRRAPIVEVKAVEPPSPLAVLPTWCLGHTVLSKGRTLQVLFAYCAHADKTGVTRCSQERIALLLGISRQLVSRHVKRLEQAGIMRIYYRRHVGAGHMMNVMQVIFDRGNATTPADARSIASPTQHSMVAQVNGSDRNLSTGPNDLRNTSCSVGRYATPGDGPTQHVRTPDLRNSLTVAQSLLKPKPIALHLETAEQAIAHWLAYAWIHGSTHPVANDEDLQTAHALIAKGITADELETEILADPESLRLAPLVRNLLS